MTLHFGRNMADEVRITSVIVFRSVVSKQITIINRSLRAVLGSLDMEPGITTTQLLWELEQIGVRVTERTIQNWVKDGLLPEPARCNLGRGKGQASLHAPEVLDEAFAAWELMHGGFNASPAAVAEARRIALHIEPAGYASRKDVFEDEKLREMVKGKPVEAILAGEWLRIKISRSGFNGFESEEALFEEVRSLNSNHSDTNEEQTQDGNEITERLIELDDLRYRWMFISSGRLAGALVAVATGFNVDWESGTGCKFASGQANL